ncbi:MAG: hypothetical protein HY646_13010 [Acidobacteria bacterium]|nr:hypothetical protein [Acidobacteriota bacterium]
MKKSALILFLFLVASPLNAQQARNGLTGLQFVSPLQITVGNDSNFLIDRSQPGERLFFLSLPPSVQPFAPSALPRQFDDQLLIIALPTTGIVSDSQRRQFALTYQPEFELFRRNSDRNAANHVALADFTYQLTRKLQITASDGFRNSSDPSRTLQNVFLLLPRGSYSENSLRASATYNISELTSFGVRFDHTITKFGQVDQFQRRMLDTMAKGISLIGARMLARNHRLRGTYSILDIDPINRVEEGDDEVDFDGPDRPTHSVGVEYRFSPNVSTVFEVNAGAVNTAFATNATFGALVDRRLGTMWLGGGYSRSVSFYAGGPGSFANGIAPSSFYQTVFFRLRGQPTRRLGLQLSAQGSQSVYGAFVEDSKSALARARVDYRLSDRTVVFFNAESYQQNRNEWIAAPVSRNRLFAGIEFSFSDEYERRTSRLNRDAENVELIEQRRRRPPRR